MTDQAERIAGEAFALLNLELRKEQLAGDIREAIKAALKDQRQEIIGIVFCECQPNHGDLFARIDEQVSLSKVERLALISRRGYSPPETDWWKLANDFIQHWKPIQGSQFTTALLADWLQDNFATQAGLNPDWNTIVRKIIAMQATAQNFQENGLMTEEALRNYFERPKSK